MLRKWQLAVVVSTESLMLLHDLKTYSICGVYCCCCCYTLQLERDRRMVNPWTDMEKCIFLDQVTFN
jgi:hypothetical protein